VTHEQTQAARRAYYGAVSYVDDQVGVLLASLRDAGFAENTVVLLLADHGDMLGERGLWYKMNFFEPACRIPLIVHAPGRFEPRRVAGSASLVDIMPTLCEFAGAATAGYATPVDGHSLAPYLAGAARTTRDARPDRAQGQNPAAPHDEVIGEYLAEGAIAPLVMIKRGRYKFVHSPADPDQLYDLVQDPDEIQNIAAEPAHAARVQQLRDEVGQRWDLAGLGADVLASQQRRHLVYQALRQGRYTPWDFQPLRDASRLYVRNDQDLRDLEAMARFPRFEL
jgi:choline-sulfatase